MSCSEFCAPLSPGSQLGSLQTHQKADYERDGFVLIENAVPPDVLRRLQSVTFDLIEQSRQVTHNNDVYDLNTRRSKDNPRLNRIKTPHDVHPVYEENLRSDALLGLIQPLLGEHI